jgi:predicted metalloprotease with PDZ domain
MRKKLLLIFTLLCALQIAKSNDIDKHSLYVKIKPTESFIEVFDTIQTHNNSYEFNLNTKFTPKLISGGKSLILFKKHIATEGSEKIDRWIIDSPEKRIILHYKGKMIAPIKQSPVNYQRGFGESAGIISEKGVFLSGGSYWYPMQAKEQFVSFDVTVALPQNWKSVSQGIRIKESTQNNIHFDKWQCDSPQDQIYLVAAQFKEYDEKERDNFSAMAFLRTPDENLANKYIEVTKQYLQMYEELIGDFPYKKFALVENFWETGYGMPSFTLLGEKIIRFPFILHSSYPHELLHNWWGNSVYVDYKTGNWCEGLTAYLADHLIKEQRNQAKNYRRTTLQNFTNYVNEENDFPISEFTSRHNSASESIGYGKSLMMFHQLRKEVGDENFTSILKEFYKNNKFKTASFNDFKVATNKVTQKDYSDFFKQWVLRTGAPQLKIEKCNIKETNGNFLTEITLSQTQESAPFNINIPIEIISSEGRHVQTVSMTKKQQTFEIKTQNKPLRVSIDPNYDVFRKVSPLEAPPAFSKILSGKKNIFIMPSKATKKQKAIYNSFITAWKKGVNENFIVLSDKEITNIPTDKTVWILGFDNKHKHLIEKQLAEYSYTIGGKNININNKTYPIKNNVYVFSVYHPEDNHKQICLINIENEKSISGLIRKLPHYGKYSYLGFTDDAPDNILKGTLPVINSPLSINYENNLKEPAYKETALAYLKPVFSKKRMINHIDYLASKELKGRGLGTKEIELAGDYIEKKFKEFGLKPVINNSYNQYFTKAFHKKGNIKIRNIVAKIEGKSKQYKNSPVVISAHYDHLGMGWPDVKKGNENKIHYGADDNASGVAILLELAKTLGKSITPERDIIFIATSGEEHGLLGAKHFVKERKKYIKGEIFANINLDTDGRLFDKKILILNSNTAREWKFIFMGTDYTTGFKTDLITQDLDASDQKAFIEAGIPAIQIFAGANLDYHTPNDTKDKIDIDGMVKIATVSKEVITYLANRTDALTNQITNNNKATHPHAHKKAKARRVSTGSMPDFSYKGEGVKIGAISKDSAGEKAGLQKGDIITKIDGKTVKGLRDYSTKLKAYSPGDKIKFEIKRNGETKIIELKLGSR